jgi:hypothetical protein
MSLCTGADLPVCALRDADGKPAGALLGFAIDLDARVMIHGDWQAPVALGPDVDGFAAAVLNALGGRFIWVLAAGDIARIYPDGSAQVPCVFDAAARMAGSTAHALLEDAAYEARFDTALHARLGVDGEGWFPGGLTAHKGIDRLLPNHYLDMTDWTVTRFAPLSDPGTATDPETIVGEIIGIMQAQVEALVHADKKPAFALTGGHETRVLLSLARPYIDRVDFVTVTGSDRHQMDSVLAKRISDDLGLHHITLPRQEADAAARKLFIRRGGHCNGDSNSRFHPSVHPIAASHNFIGGLGGENARAFLWRDADTADTTLNSHVMTNRFGLPQTPELTARLEQWFAELPAMNAFLRQDVAYHEHRNGAWACVQFCSDPGLVRHAPLLTHRSVALMLQLPPEWKRGNRLGAAIIHRLWPELEKYPYNSLGPLRDAWIKLQRLIDNPKVIFKKLRKMRG